MLSRETEIAKVRRATPPALRELTRHLSPAAASWKPQANERVAAEVGAHVADVDERALSRVRRTLRGQHPTLSASSPEGLALERAYIEVDQVAQAQRPQVGLVLTFDEDATKHPPCGAVQP